MNKEEKESIGNLKIIAEYIGENYFFGRQGIENLKKDINVTLNYLNHLHKEIEEQDETIEKSVEEQKEREKYTHELEEKLVKKDKVIDIAVKQIEKQKEMIDNLTEGEEDCFIPDTYSNIDDCVKKKTCADCIKEYFYKQVEEENAKN